MHLKIQQPQKEEYNQLMAVWESSVKATHHFLNQEDFEFYKQAIPGFFPHVNLYTLSVENTIVAFMGIADKHLEMLFVHAEARGKGYGKILLEYAIQTLHIQKLDVNEQNRQAIGFYEKFGFKTVSRSEKDSMGKKYPILHLVLTSEYE